MYLRSENILIESFVQFLSVERSNFARQWDDGFVARW